MCDREFFQPVELDHEETLDGSPSSNKSGSSTLSQDEQFVSKTGKEFGGVIHVAPGIWKSVYRLSCRGVEYCPGFEENLFSGLEMDLQANLKKLFHPEMSASLAAVAKSVGTLYIGNDWAQTAQFIGTFENIDLAISCNHRLAPNVWNVGDLVNIDFGSEAILGEGPSSHACPAVVLRINLTMDIILMAITKWITPRPPALTPHFDLNLITNEPVYAIGYNGRPKENEILVFQKFQMTMFNESITLSHAEHCFKSGFRMVSLGNVTQLDCSTKKALVSASLWYGSSGSPVFVMRDSLVNIGHVVSSNASNNNVIHLYDSAIKADIDAAVFRIALMKMSKDHS
ncbi:hypothetical protein PGT21_010189 [Puccinia graminis f. sp. tritici]|uniref:Serine protease n=1 Tax=Puccinia graminis f. sp. tritici TaxID=56615 RepID=A0A5B0SDN7_PUCGR|nr:hypothetical protein PGT21_010189 [Puccinia graminis f. sp. tritici]KAA1135947.1 hypothetical protein PGTUg99_006928 [Puccinia graminis f. sp. tritici]